MRRRATHRGFTLVELVIAIAVIAVLAAAAVPALNSVTGANVRTAAGELAGAMRYLYDVASLRRETCRLALDLDERQWWAECTKDRVFAGREAILPEDEAREAEEELEDRFPDDRDAEKRRLLAKATWGKFEDRIAKKHDLPGDARFDEVWSEHLREPARKGRAFIYFFPGGRAESARVPIVDGDHAWSVVLQPMTGRARIVPGKPEVAR